MVNHIKKIVVALIGYGMSGRQFHLPPLLENPNYLVKSVMTRNEKNQQDLLQLVPQAVIITNYQDVLDDPTIDLVILATSNDVHYAYTKEALLKGKHVVCEKPFVETYLQAKELYDLAHEKHLVLRVFHNRKYDGDFLTTEDLMRTRDFGKIVSFSTRFDRYVPEIGANWRFKKGDMAGIYYDLAPHLVHHVIKLFGLPTHVHNVILRDREGSLVDDHFEMTLYYPDKTCYLGAQMLDRHPKPRIEVVGTKATYVKYGFDIPDSVHQKEDARYQTTSNRSDWIEIGKQVEHIPVYLGRHYLFYENLYTQILNPAQIDFDQKLALSVILVMEKGWKANEMREILEIPTI